MPRHVKHAHDDVPGVGHDEHRSKRFEHPLEEDERIEVVHVVAVDQHLDQLQAHDEGQDDAGDGNHDVLGQTSDHAEDAAVPCLRRSTDCTCDIRDLGIDAVKQPGQVADHTANQQLFKPLCNLVPDKVQRGIPPLCPLPGSRGRAKDWLVRISRKGRRAAERESCRSGPRRRPP